MVLEVRGNSPKSVSSATPSLEGLKVGSRGPDVIALQKALNLHVRGAQLEPDGHFGPATEDAVKRFQGPGGSGRVDAATAAALEQPVGSAAAETPAAAAANCEAPPAQVQESRRRVLGGEELAKAKIAGVTAAEAKGEKYEVVSEENLSRVTANLEQTATTVGQQKVEVAKVRQQLEGQCRALEAKPNRTVPEDALLQGKQAQVQVLAATETHLDHQQEVIARTMDSLSDGVVTAGEDQAFNIGQEALIAERKVIGDQDDQATKVVGMAEKAGATLPATPGAGEPTDIYGNAAAPPAPVVSLDDVKKETGSLRTKMNQQRAELSVLKSAPPKEPEARAAFDSEVALKEKEVSLTQHRIADLGKAEQTLARGPLSAEDNQALATSKSQYETQSGLVTSGRKAFAGVAAIREKMIQESGSPEEFLVDKREAANDANAALKRAQSRGNPEALRAATAVAGKANADYQVALHSKRLIDSTHAALNDGNVDANESANIDKIGASIKDSAEVANVHGEMLPALDAAKSWGSDLKDRVYSWFVSAPEVGDAVIAHGREIS